MASLRYLLPALAIAGRAAAQCSAATTTLSSAADATAIGSCSTFTGSIAIATSVSETIDLGDIKKITGSLTAMNVPNMTTLQGEGLETIGDSFTLVNIQTLSTLIFPLLTAVDTVDWEGLPNLQGLSFSATLQTASSLSIQNTQLTSLDGIDLQQIDSLTLANNPYLNEVTMQLGYVGASLIMEANGNDVVADFPNMQYAYNLTFRNCSSVLLPSLASVNTSIGLYSDYFTTFSTPNLTTIGGDLSFVSNSDVTNISMPALKTIGGGFQIANNSALGDVNGFANLATIGGAIDFTGVFTSVELPALANVKGAFTIASTKNITASCNHFNGLQGSRSSIIKGKYSCVDDDASSGTSTSGGTGSTTSGSSSSATSSSPANPIYISGATGLMGVVAAIFGML